MNRVRGWIVPLAVVAVVALLTTYSLLWGKLSRESPEERTHRLIDECVARGGTPHTAGSNGLFSSLEFLYCAEATP